jgi:hypothetical protein
VSLPRCCRVANGTHFGYALGLRIISVDSDNGVGVACQSTSGVSSFSFCCVTPVMNVCAKCKSNDVTKVSRDSSVGILTR